MKYALLLSAVALVAVSHAQPAAAQTAPADLVKQAVDAQGGADALRALKSLTIKGEGKLWEPGQSFKAGGESKFVADMTFTVTADVANKAIRVDWDRDNKYPSVEKQKYSDVVFPTFGIAVNDKGEQQPMSGIRLAAHQREYGRGSPLLLLRALDAPQNVAASPDQKLGDKSLPAVTFKEGVTTYVILFDPATKLPAAVRTRDDDHIYGDSNYDLVLSDWKAVGGAKLAHSLSFQLNGGDVQKLTYKDVAANAPIAPATFAVNEEVKAKAKAAATSGVPYQWVIRRLFLGRFLDSDDVYYPAGGGFKLSELGPNVQQVVGGGANNLIVAMNDGIVIFDAPVNEGQSRWVIDAAKAKYPGKPIKYLVLTHHHMDHTGGMRTYAAEGATILVPAPTKIYFERVVKAPHTVAPDALEKQPKSVKIDEVKDVLSLKDDTVEIRLYNIPNPHADGMIIGHIVKDNVVWVTDLISPRGPVGRNPGTVAVGDALRKHGISGATIAGGHGTTAKQADIAAALAAN